MAFYMWYNIHNYGRIKMNELEETIKKANRKNKFDRIVVRPRQKLLNFGKKIKRKMSDFYEYITSDKATRETLKFVDEKITDFCEDRYQEYLTIHNPDNIGKFTSNLKYKEDPKYALVQQNILYTDKGPLIKTIKTLSGEDKITFQPYDEEVRIFEGFFPNAVGDYEYTYARCVRKNEENGLRSIQYDIFTRNKKGKFDHKKSKGILMMKNQDKIEFDDHFKAVASYYTSKANEKKYMKVSENEL